jgi:hypothetical protein
MVGSCPQQIGAAASVSDKSIVEVRFIFLGLTSRCGTGYRERHSATGLKVVIKRVTSTQSG